MPAVKWLHQQSESNSKPHFIMGHSFQAFGILCRVSGYYFCVPICARIHEGIVRSNRDRKTLIDKAGMMLKDAFGDEHSFVLIADAYYANGKMLKSQAATGSQLITRVLSNTVAYEPPAPVAGKRKRGRPKKYGRKRTLSSLFGPTTEFTKLNCPVYGEVVCMCAMLALICSALETNRRHGAFCSGRAPIQRAHDSYVFGSLALSWANHRALFFAL
jgi:hypothetical protein